MAYWKVVLSMLVDSLTLSLRLSFGKLVNKESLEMETVNELIGSFGNGIERLMEE